MDEASAKHIANALDHSDEMEHRRFRQNTPQQTVQQTQAVQAVSHTQGLHEEVLPQINVLFPGGKKVQLLPKTQVKATLMKFLGLSYLDTIEIPETFLSKLSRCWRKPPNSSSTLRRNYLRKRGLTSNL